MTKRAPRLSPLFLEVTGLLVARARHSLAGKGVGRIRDIALFDGASGQIVRLVHAD